MKRFEKTGQMDISRKRKVYSQLLSKIFQCFFSIWKFRMSEILCSKLMMKKTKQCEKYGRGGDRTLSYHLMGFCIRRRRHVVLGGRVPGKTYFSLTTINNNIQNTTNNLTNQKFEISGKESCLPMSYRNTQLILTNTFFMIIKIPTRPTINVLTKYGVIWKQISDCLCPQI